MKVLYLTNIPSPYRVEFFNELCNYCDLTVIFERKYAADRNENWFSQENSNFNSIFLNGIKVGAEKALCPSIIKHINNNEYDIIVIGGYSTPTAMVAIEYLRLKKIPFVLNTDGGFIKKDKINMKVLKKHFISSANWWLSTGKEANKYLEYYGANLAKTFIYPFTSTHNSEIVNSPSTKNEKQEIKKELGFNDNKIILGVGQFIYRKGFDLVIEACSQINKKFTLVLVGGGSEKKYYYELISNARLKNVEIVDFKKKEELKKYYKSADIFIMPTREDIWGLVVNEAMAQGLPIISTDAALSARQLVIDEKNGWIIQKNDISSIVKIVNRALEDECKIEEMSRESLSIIKEYTIENMAKVHMAIFQQIAKEG